MSFSIFKLVAFLTASAVGLAACGSGPSSASNPNYFDGRVTDNVLTGEFNPNGFTQAQVRKLTSDVCSSGKLIGFGTQPLENGQVGYSASCETWSTGARFVQFERTSGSSVVIEITGGIDGQVFFGRIDTSV